MGLGYTKAFGGAAGFFRGWLARQERRLFNAPRLQPRLTPANPAPLPCEIFDLPVRVLHVWLSLAARLSRAPRVCVAEFTRWGGALSF